MNLRLLNNRDFTLEKYEHVTMEAKDKIGVLMITTTAAPRIRSLISRLSSKYEIHVIYIAYPSIVKALNDEVTDFHYWPVKCPSKVFSLAESRKFNQLYLLPIFIGMLIKIIWVRRKYHVDIIHVHDVVPSGFLAALSGWGIPMIVGLRGSDIKVFGKKLMFRYPTKYALKRATKITALSNDLKKEAIELGAKDDKICVIPSGIDTNLFRPIDKKATRTILGMKDCFQIIFTGNLISLKRVDMLIRVCSRLFRHYPHIYLTIVGEGPERANLEQLTRDGDFENVQFTGRIAYDKMPLYIGASDVLVLPSKSEGLPDCVQEAMACGVPVIATNVGGLPELIEDGINGYLVKSEDELQTYLEKLIKCPELAVSMGENALEFAKRNLRLDVAVEQTEKLYNSVLKRQ